MPWVPQVWGDLRGEPSAVYQLPSGKGRPVNNKAQYPEWMESIPEAMEAIESGGNWNSSDGALSITEMMLFCPFRDDNDEWEESHIGYEWIVEDGRVWVQETYLDNCGDIDYGERRAFDEDPGWCDTLCDEQGKDSDKANRGYEEYVAKTGDDPLGQFYVRTRIEAKQKWQVRFSNSIGGPVLFGARRNGRGEWSHSGEGCPQGLLEFLELEQRNPTGVHRFTGEGGMDTLCCWAVSDERVKFQRDSRYLKMMVTIDANRPRSESAIRRDLKRAARRSLATMGRS